MDDQDREWASVLIKADGQRVERTETQNLRQVLLNFLEVLDSLDRLLAPGALTEQSPGFGSSEHLQVLRSQLIDIFEHSGVAFFNCIGQPFDPTRHEALKAVQSHEHDDYTIMEVITRGCEWRGKVLRFARVVVARNPG